MVVHDLPIDQLKQTFLCPRPLDCHKGDWGQVTVIGGHPGMLGAALMAGHAALAMGAGKVTIATHASHFEWVPLYRPELISVSLEDTNSLATHLQQTSVVVLGPGLGVTDSACELLRWVSEHYQGPLLIDADALNILAAQDISFQNECVITPHPGEAARLLRTTSYDVQNDRVAAVEALFQAFKAVTVLKGHHTLVGYQNKAFCCRAGNPGMATAGSGDILSGVIGSLLAQGLPCFEAAQLGVALHAEAGDRAELALGERRLCATDIITYL